MDKMANVSEYLLRAILELIEKCHTIEELRESVKRILKDEQKRIAAAPQRTPLLSTKSGEPGALPRPPP